MVPPQPPVSVFRSLRAVASFSTTARTGKPILEQAEAIEMRIKLIATRIINFEP
jgi:hypothetical protein